MSSATVFMPLEEKAFSNTKRKMAKSTNISLKCNSTYSVKTHVISSFLWNAEHDAHVQLLILRRQPMHSLMLFVTLAIFITRFPTECHAVGYSYARFVGPVIGPEHEILVHDNINGGTRLDYIAHPEYQFAYGVEDSETQVLQNRKETRNGDEVKGVYSVVDPDGVLRVVKYTADNLNGFQAEVITNGVATIHGQNNDAIKDNDGANYHVKTGHKNDHGNNYEVHDEYDENSEDQSKNTKAGSSHYNNHDNYDDDDDDDGDDVEENGESKSEEYEESKSGEVSEANEDSDEIEDY